MNLCGAHSLKMVLKKFQRAFATTSKQCKHFNPSYIAITPFLAGILQSSIHITVFLYTCGVWMDVM